MRLEDLPITVCGRAPHLSDAAHLAAIDEQLERLTPKICVLDPLYLSARGADMKDLYAMGAVLEAIQLRCQRVGASLLVVTHFNRGQGQGAGRITGAGPAEWGRVLISATVKARHTDRVTKATRVLTELDIIGGEIPDQRLLLHRHIWADDPEDRLVPSRQLMQALRVFANQATSVASNRSQ